jgi:hypothetical protein
MMNLIDEQKEEDECQGKVKDEDELLKESCLVYMKENDEYLQRLFLMQALIQLALLLGDILI